MGDFMTLADMKENQNAIILKIESDSGLSRRLFDMGFMVGQNVSCTNVGAFGSPIAYNLRGCKVALRKKDAQKLTVEVVL